MELRCRYLVAMDSSDPASPLSHDDLLSLSIGRAIRAHALLEYRLRNVHEALDDPGPDGGVAAGLLGADRLVSGCLVMLRRATVTREITEAGEGSLRAAREANALRNRIVHDLWLLDPRSEVGDSPRWNTFRARRDQRGAVARPGPSDIGSVEDARTELERTGVRLSGLFMALHEVLPRFQEARKPRGWTSGLPTYLALMRGHFRLEPNGDWEISSPG